MKKGSILEGTVVSRSFPNKGIVLCESGEQAVVKDVLPGQRISFCVTKNRHGKAEGRCLEVLKASDIEIESQCSHYPGCGGCSYRTLRYEDQVELKTNQVKKLLEPALSRQTDQPVWEDTVVSPEADGYRNKMEFSFGDGYKDGPLELGLHKKGSFYDILSVTDCRIVDEDFRLVLKTTLEFFREKNVPYLHRMSHEGILRHLLVRKAKKTGELLVALVTTSGLTAVKDAHFPSVEVLKTRATKVQMSNEVIECRQTDGATDCQSDDVLEAISKNSDSEVFNGKNLDNECLEKSGELINLVAEWNDRLQQIVPELKGTLAGVLHIINDTLSDVIKADEVRILNGRDYINEELLGLKFKISVFSFFQTNSLGAEKLYETARSFIGDIGMGTDGQPDKTVFDLYSGTGTIAQLMAPVAKKVVGVEIVEEAVEAAKVNAVENGISNCDFLAGDVLKVIDNIEDKPDFLILDPPRDGIHPKALPKLIGYGVDRILYVSCKPTSLARDLESFIDAGYEAQRIACVDMFPFTNGIETICLLSRETSQHAKDYIQIGIDAEEYYQIKNESK